MTKRRLTFKCHHCGELFSHLVGRGVVLLKCPFCHTLCEADVASSSGGQARRVYRGEEGEAQTASQPPDPATPIPTHPPAREA